MISLKHLVKTYHGHGAPVHAVRDVSLDVAEGRIFGVIGASGAGKSTLIRCVNLLERPDAGEVWVNGRDLLTLTDAELRQARRQIGMIFQHFNLLSTRSVFDNVALPLELAGLSRSDIAARVQPLLALTGLEARADHYPAQLSGGQKQRVAIARALASEPKVLLCDEATSALDPETTRSILALLRDINEKLGLTILLITHEMDVIKTLCDEVALMEDGAVVERGPVQAFFARPQSATAKRFVQAALERPLPETILSRLQSAPAAGLDPLVRITYVGGQVDAPVLSHLSREFGVDVNILSSQIELIQHQPLGFMVAQVEAQDQPAAEAALAWLQQQELQVEVLGYVSR